MEKITKVGVAAALGTFVVTAVFVRSKTVRARSQAHALQLAEEQGLCEQGENQSLSNWHAQEVDAA